ncbi:MAG: hypothetical protein INR64_19260 [Caulobacteraceae bacterium]|nr:hypothetical protein [Caulobacter sp.]
MRFLLQCVICLGLLYAAILRHDGWLVEPSRLVETAATLPRQAGASLAAAAGPQIAARLEAFCRQDPDACLTDATMLARPLAIAVPAAAPARKGRLPLAAGVP